MLEAWLQYVGRHSIQLYYLVKINLSLEYKQFSLRGRNVPRYVLWFDGVDA